MAVTVLIMQSYCILGVVDLLTNNFVTGILSHIIMMFSGIIYCRLCRPYVRSAFAVCRCPGVVAILHQLQY